MKILDKIVEKIKEEYYPSYVYSQSIPVHALIYCRRKYELQKMVMERGDLYQEYYEQGINERVLVGSILHKGLEQFLGYTPYTFVKQLDEYIISGRPDYIDFDNKIVYEFKFSQHAKLSVPEWYHRQVDFYKWLTGFGKAFLVVFTPTHIQTFKMFGKVYDNYIRDYIKEWKEKVPLYNWECKYCPYYKLCKGIRWK